MSSKTDEKVNFESFIQAIEGAELDQTIYIDFDQLKIAYDKLNIFFEQPKITISMMTNFINSEFVDSVTGESLLSPHISNMQLWLVHAKLAINGNSKITNFVNNVATTPANLKGSFKDMIILNGLIRRSVETTEIENVELLVCDGVVKNVDDEEDI